MPYRMEDNKQTLHIGQVLKAHIDRNKISKSALARYIGKDPGVILHYQKRESLQLSVLWELSLAVKHNFFSDIASKLPTEFSTDVPKDQSKDIRISELEREIEILKAEKNMLLQVLQNK
ncbi:hypothetical protein NZ698_16890 [Chryseobacterium sp. PBS4-4]|uniref:XRE family transcriptional regulator n=1 Tax=Chryseobacterium edaphi TaxID=2976532 RepID=A0ABT2WBQ7_9FLAO|nr:hypothetical protein [Chryseobacterium edaphi]MCU7618859.1 hypothetical protein [Chryseobacterium edaphi]